MAEVLRSRYLRTLTAVLAPAAAVGCCAGTRLPHPYAVMVMVGAITAAVAAPFIIPIDPPPEEGS